MSFTPRLKLEVGIGKKLILIISSPSFQKLHPIHGFEL
jgi:hypothetical protein